MLSGYLRMKYSTEVIETFIHFHLIQVQLHVLLLHYNSYVPKIFNLCRTALGSVNWCV